MVEGYRQHQAHLFSVASVRFVVQHLILVPVALPPVWSFAK